MDLPKATRRSYLTRLEEAGDCLWAGGSFQQHRRQNVEEKPLLLAEPELSGLQSVSRVTHLGCTPLCHGGREGGRHPKMIDRRQPLPLSSDATLQSAVNRASKDNHGWHAMDARPPRTGFLPQVPSPSPCPIPGLRGGSVLDVCWEMARCRYPFSQKTPKVFVSWLTAFWTPGKVGLGSIPFPWAVPLAVQGYSGKKRGTEDTQTTQGQKWQRKSLASRLHLLPDCTPTLRPQPVL